MARRIFFTFHARVFEELFVSLWPEFGNSNKGHLKRIDIRAMYRTDCQQIAAQIAATDSEIDRRVFDLYGLTDEERKVVMGT